MNILIIDFQTILHYLNNANVSTKTFEIYYDICRLLEIDVSKEACFKLYTRYADNPGKLKEYLCMLKVHADKAKFDEEFFRRYKQLYFNVESAVLEQKKKNLQQIFTTLANDHMIAVIGIGNKEMITYTLNYFDLFKYLNAVKTSEFGQYYEMLLSEFFTDTISEENPPQKTVFVFDQKQQELKDHIANTQKYEKYNPQFASFDELITS